MELPEELLQLIFSHLLSGVLEPETVRGKEVETLRALCLANKQCYRIAQPLLYHTLHLNEWSGDFDIIATATKFARYPRLASFVREIHVDVWQSHPRDDDDDLLSDEIPIPLEASVARIFEDALQSLRPLLDHHADHVLVGLKEGWEDAHLAFLFAQCQNLELIEMDISYEFTASFVHAVLHHFATVDKYDSNTNAGGPRGAPIGLPKLRELAVQHWDTEGGVKMKDIEGLLCKASIEVFRGHMITMAGEDNYFAFEVQPWHIQHISLTESLMDSNGLETLLRCCSRLEYLNVKYGGSLIDDECVLDFNEFGRALRKYGQGLQTIGLDNRDWETFEYADEDIVPPIGDLTPLTRLKNLTIPELALVGYGRAHSDLEDEEDFEPQILTETLPPSLQALEILELDDRADADELDSRLLELMGSDHFSQLTLILIERPYPFPRKAELSAMGWNDTKSSKYMNVLERGDEVFVADPSNYSKLPNV